MVQEKQKNIEST